MEPEHINSKELVKRTKATYRQIDYWCRYEVIKPIGDGNPGSGHRRLFDASIVDRVALLARVTKVFGGDMQCVELKKIYRNYEKGFVNMGKGITLHWELE